MFKKKALSCIALTLVLCIVMAVPASAFYQFSFRGYTKNMKQQGAGKHGRFMINKGIFKGDGKGQYFWGDYVTRADIVVMIVRAFQLSAVMKDNFPDVEKNSYYYDAIRTAKSLGIARGYGMMFGPQRSVTIGEAILFIERAVAVANSNTQISVSVDLRALYSKADLSDYATRDDIAYMLYFVLTGDTEPEEDYDLAAIEYQVDEDDYITFDVDDFEKALKENKKELDYVKFTLPESTYGTLYYDYKPSANDGGKVKASTNYYADEDDGKALANVTFVPYTNYNGIASIQYEAFDTAGKSYTGIIEIDVLETDDDLETVTYKTKKGTPVQFDSDDFDDVLDKETDEDLDYVKFNLPASTYGKLYYNYRSSSKNGTAVKGTTKYYADSDDGDELSRVTFVPSANYTGTVAIGYTAFDEEGDSYTGIIKIVVQNTGTGLDAISFDTKEDQAETFGADLIEALEDEMDEDLDYVIFTLPGASYGKLYYNYKSTSEAAVKANTKYCADPEGKELDLKKVTFVPYSNYTGTVTFGYTAVDEEGDSYTGKIAFRVHELLDKISYETEEDSAVRFDEDDFSEVLAELTNKDLNYVQFILPDSKEGKLYYDYKTSKNYGSVVKASNKYYYDPDNGADLSEITFVPYSGYTGTVSIRYTAFDASGNSFNGIIEIEVEED